MDGVVELPLAGLMLTANGSGDPRGQRVALPCFLVGQENLLLPEAMKCLLERSTCGYSPVVFHGNHGTGKTHVSFGIASLWRDRHPQEVVTYLTALDYANQLDDALATHDISQFRQHYHRGGLSVLENVEQLGGKPAAQQELLFMLDAAELAGRWMVITSLAAPAATEALMPALRSRLSAGLVVPLVSPGLATRQAVLLRLAELLQMQLSPAAVGLLAQRLPVTVPELYAALTDLQSIAARGSNTVTRELARQYLDSPQDHPRATLHAINAATASLFRLKQSELRSSSRRQPVAVARAVAMYLARRLTTQSVRQIGHYFGGRDHTTVLHASRRAETLLHGDTMLQRLVEQLEAKWKPA